MTRHLAHLALALLTSLTTWSCAAQAADVVRIGAPLALTGSLADEGKKQALAYDLWLTRVNAAGGIDVGGQKKKVDAAHLRLPERQQARAAARRKAHHRRQGACRDGAVWLGPHQDRRRRRRALRHPGRRVRRLVGVGVRPGLQEPVRHAGAQLRARRRDADALHAGAARRLKKVAILGRDDVFPRDMAESAPRTRAGAQGSRSSTPSSTRTGRSTTRRRSPRSRGSRPTGSTSPATRRT